MSLFWFDNTGGICPNHFVSEEVPYEVAGRAIRVTGSRCTRSSASCAGTFRLGVERVPGAGRGLRDRAARRVTESDASGAIFTPATKAEIGEHDENVGFERAPEIVGDRPLMQELRRVSMRSTACGSMPGARIVLADTKFEFGASPGPRWSLATRCYARFVALLARRRIRARPVPAASTSGICAIRWTRSARIAAPRRRSSRTRWSPTPGPSTSRRTSESPAEPWSRCARGDDETALFDLVAELLQRLPATYSNASRSSADISVRQRPTRSALGGRLTSGAGGSFLGGDRAPPQRLQLPAHLADPLLGPRGGSRASRRPTAGRRSRRPSAARLGVGDQVLVAQLHVGLRGQAPRPACAPGSSSTHFARRHGDVAGPPLTRSATAPRRARRGSGGRSAPREGPRDPPRLPRVRRDLSPQRGLPSPGRVRP